jgi:hypothetical protein
MIRNLLVAAASYVSALRARALQISRSPERRPKRERFGFGRHIRQREQLS